MIGGWPVAALAGASAGADDEVLGPDGVSAPVLQAAALSLAPPRGRRPARPGPCVRWAISTSDWRRRPHPDPAGPADPLAGDARGAQFHGRGGFGSTPDEARRIWWDTSSLWGPPEDHFQQLCHDGFRPVRIRHRSAAPYTEAAVAELDLLELELEARRARVRHVRSLMTTRSLAS